MAIHKVLYNEDIEYDETNPKHRKARSGGKAVSFASLYGAQASTIALNSGMSIKTRRTCSRVGCHLPRHTQVQGHATGESEAGRVIPACQRAAVKVNLKRSARPGDQRSRYKAQVPRIMDQAAPKVYDRLRAEQSTPGCASSFTTRSSWRRGKDPSSTPPHLSRRR